MEARSQFAVAIVLLAALSGLSSVCPDAFGQRIDTEALLQPSRLIDRRALESPFSRGYRLLLSNRPAAALDYFRSKAGRHGGAPEIQSGLALALHQSGQPEYLARLHARKAAQVAPGWLSPRVVTGLLYLRAHDFESASKELQVAVRLAPDSCLIRVLHAYALVFPYDYVNPEFLRWDRAFQELDRALETASGCTDARMLRAFYLWRQGTPDSALEVLKTLPDSADFVLFPPFKRWILAAWCFLDLGQAAAADRAFRHAFQLMPSEERRLYSRLDLVSAPTQRTSGLEAGLQQVRAFWESRDPEPLTEVNERLLEHYRRVSYAREFYAFGKEPWDERGEIYIRYGEPDVRIETQTPAGVLSDIREGYKRGTDPEKLQRVEEYLDWLTDKLGGYSYPASLWWFYVDLAGHSVVDFPFLPLASGGQIFQLSDSVGKIHDLGLEQLERRVADLPTVRYRSLVARQPEAARYHYEAESIDLPFLPVQFKSARGRTELIVYYGLPPTRLVEGTSAGPGGLDLKLERGVVVWDSTWQRVVQKSGTRLLRLTRGTLNPKALVLDLVGVRVPPGSLHVAFEVRAELNGHKRIAIYRFNQFGRDFSRSMLMLSSVVPAQKIFRGEKGRFARGGWIVLPNPARRYRPSELVWLYFEVYNLKLGPDGRTRSRLEIRLREAKSGRLLDGVRLRLLQGLVGGRQEKSQVALESTFEGSSRKEAVVQALDIKAVPPGEYRLQVVWHDLIGGQRAAAETALKVVR